MQEEPGRDGGAGQIDTMYRILAMLIAGLLLAATGAHGGPVPVKVVKVVPAETAERLRLTGTVTAERRARLSPRVSGLVAAVHVDAGDEVEPDEVLVELDPAIARLELRAARAALAEAEARVAEAERLRKEALPLVEERHIPETEARAREARVRLEEAAAERLRAEVASHSERIERHRVVAPFGGFVNRKLTEAGEWVETGTPVIDLVAIDRLRLDVQVPQERFGQIDEDTGVIVRLDGVSGQAFPGRVIARVPVNDPGARTFLVRVEVTEPEGRMIPGMSAEAEFSIPGAKEALMVPRDALVRQPDGSYRVWVVESKDGEKRAFPRSVRIGRSLQESVEVLEGLDGTLPVVTRGNETLREGQTVELAGGA